MKFVKGMREGLLWDYLHFNIFDDLDEGKMVDYSKQTFMERFLIKDGVLNKDVEIIVKINGKKVKDCWEKKK